MLKQINIFEKIFKKSLDNIKTCDILLIKRKEVLKKYFQRRKNEKINGNTTSV